MLFSVETDSSKSWSVKYTKIRKKIGIHFFSKSYLIYLTYLSYFILYCKNYNFKTIYLRIYELLLNWDVAVIFPSLKDCYTNCKW